MNASAPVPEGLPTGGQVRAHLHHRTTGRGPTSRADLASDLYTIAFTVLVWVAMTIGLLQGLGADARQVLAGQGTHAPVLLAHPTWLVLTLAALALTGTWSVLARLGPMGLPPAHRVWLLALPVDRRGLLAGGLWARTAVAAFLGLLAGLVVGLAAPEVAGHGLPLIAGPALGALGALALVHLQVSDGRRAPHRRVLLADLLVVAVLVTGLLAGAAHLPPPHLHTAGAGWVPGALTAALVLAGAALAALAPRRIELLHDASLGTAGNATVESGGALESLDTRALGRALDRATARPGRVTAAGRALTALTRRLLPALPARLRPLAALALADAQVVARAPRRLVQVLLGALVVLLALALPGSRWVVAVGVILGAQIAVLGLMEGARQSQLAPALEDLLPVGPRAARAARLPGPLLVMALWGAAVLPLIGAQLAVTEGTQLQASSPWTWAAFGAFAAPGIAAAGLRGATRPPADHGRAPVVTPMGAVPPGVVESFTVGPDLLVAALTPVLVAILLGAVPSALLVVQAVVSLLLAAWVVWRGHRRRR